MVEAPMRPVPAAEPLSGKPHWAKVAENMAFENASLTRYFLSWLSAYLWAVEGDEKAVAVFITAAVMGDGSIQTEKVTLTIGKFSTREEEDEAGQEGAGGARAKEEEAETITHVHKTALALGVLKAAGHEPERVYAKADGKSRWFELAWSVDKAKGFLSSASLWLYAVELAGGSDEIRIKYSRALEVVGVEARLENFTTAGKRPRAKLVVRLGGDVAEYSIRLHKNNAVELHFSTTDREEAERRAAVLRAVGVRAEVKKTYDKYHNRDMWQIAVTTNALAADSVHEAVRKAVVEFLKQCREVRVLSADTYDRLVKKFEKGVPEWGEIRFSVKLGKYGTIEVIYQPSDLESFNKAVELLRGLGMGDSCEGDWCFIHFTAREPEGGRLGFVRITTDGLRYIGWLALHGNERAQWLKEMLLKEARGEVVRQRLMQYFREGEQWGSVKPPIEKEVEVEGRRVRVRVEEVEAWKEKSKTREHLVVKIRAKVIEGNSEAAVEKEARFFKSGDKIKGYVIIHAGAEGGREAEHLRTVAVLKALGVERWSRKPEQILLSGGALDTLMRLEPVCAALGQCRKT